jgi:hypothetical protein
VIGNVTTNAPSAQNLPGLTATTATFIGDAGTTSQISGMTFNFSLIHPNAGVAGAADRQTSITIFGNETGGYITVPITIRANP